MEPTRFRAIVAGGHFPVAKVTAMQDGVDGRADRLGRRERRAGRFYADALTRLAVAQLAKCGHQQIEDTRLDDGRNVVARQQIGGTLADDLDLGLLVRRRWEYGRN